MYWAAQNQLKKKIKNTWQLEGPISYLEGRKNCVNLIRRSANSWMIKFCLNLIWRYFIKSTSNPPDIISRRKPSPWHLSKIYTTTQNSQKKKDFHSFITYLQHDNGFETDRKPEITTKTFNFLMTDWIFFRCVPIKRHVDHVRPSFDIFLSNILKER